MKRMRRQVGQSIVEAVLLMTLMIGTAYVLRAALEDMEFFSKLVSGPWRNINGMITNGVWADIDESASMHPNLASRHATMFQDGGGYQCQ